MFNGALSIKRVLLISLAATVLFAAGLMFIIQGEFDDLADQFGNEAQQAQQEADRWADTAKSITPLLEVQSVRFYKEYGYAHAVGEVRNISNGPLTDVMAVVSFRDDAGNLIKTDEALITYNPILPNQVSPFQVMTTDNPAIYKGSVNFKHLMGEAIPSTEK